MSVLRNPLGRNTLGCNAPAQRGMTTIEILVSMAIMLGMFTMAWTSFSGGIRIKRNSEAINERYHEIRVAMGRMVEDLASAYISANENQTLDERRTMFIGKDSGSVDELRFTSMSHRVLWADANESEQTMISYFEESDLEDSGKDNLMPSRVRITIILENEGGDEVKFVSQARIMLQEELKFFTN